MNPAELVCLGAIWGTFNGWLSQKLLKKHMKDGKITFFAVFASLVAYRLICLAALFFIVSGQKPAVIILALSCMIIIQTAALIYSMFKGRG